ncbi:MAG: glucose-1-phosphate adenylyltransferase, partial [Candidatus Aldehydirespiratoraceae bacterium]
TRIGHEPEQDRALFTVSDEGVVVLPKDYRFDT